MSTPPVILDHPVVAQRLAKLRSADTGNEDFLRLVGELAGFVAYEAFRGLRTRPVLIDTPVVSGVEARELDEELFIVPILRAGLGMVAAVEALVTRSRLCLVGVRRNEETLRADVYLDGLPERLDGAHVVLCDPMLATGGSLIHVADMVTARGAAEVTALCLIASEVGLTTFHTAHPEVRLVCAALDPVLNERGYIVPGLGDAGDRQFGPPAHKG